MKVKFFKKVKTIFEVYTLFPKNVHEKHILDKFMHNWIGEMLEHLVPHPDYKLLTIKNIPQMSAAAQEFSTYQWHGLLKHLRQMLISDAPMEEGWSLDYFSVFLLI